ncbi:hypothetical protein B0H11DRAFT_2235918 [Mycena galericulata]|nr:hypothetical protein B0H11DRAFT_2235918 [Mycena galericulata]
MSPDFAYVFTPPRPFRMPPTTNDTAPVPAGRRLMPTEAHYTHAYIAAELRTFYSPAHNLRDPGRARHGPGADHNDDMGLESVSDPEEVEDVVGDGDVSSTSHAMSTSSHGISNSSHIAASAFSHTQLVQFHLHHEQQRTQRRG